MNMRSYFDDQTVIRSRAEFRDRGVTGRQLTAAVGAEELVRVRRGLYALPEAPDGVLRAVRIGGRVSCVSALAHAGVWVYESPFPHLQMPPSASRSRSPADRLVPLTPHNRDGCVLHWSGLVQPHAAHNHLVSPVDAMIMAVRCQHPWFAVASLDSALRVGYLAWSDLDSVFAGLPTRLRYLRPLIDRRSGSGLESVMRMILLEAGLETEIQVRIGGVGRVDFVVAGCVVVETDGAEFHGDSERPRDYDRDLTLAALRYTVIRLNYRQVMFEKSRVVLAIRTAVANNMRSPDRSRAYGLG